MKKKNVKFVKVHREIGYGDKPFSVVGEECEEYILSDDFGKRFRIYKAHCYQDHTCKMLSR